MSLDFPDSVELSDVVSDAIDALGIVDHVGAVNSAEKMAWVFFCLRVTPDTAAVFPRGKWATLQHIEAQLDCAAKLTLIEAEKERGMGYTHYFPPKRSFTGDEWLKIGRACREVVQHPDCPTLTADDESDEHGVVICDTEILFNGLGDDAHETFVVGRVSDGKFKFCKTAQKPYDAAVVACLVLMEHFAPGVLKISSDGDPTDWAGGLALAEAATGITGLSVPSGVAQ